MANDLVEKDLLLSRSGIFVNLVYKIDGLTTNENLTQLFYLGIDIFFKNKTKQKSYLDHVIHKPS